MNMRGSEGSKYYLSLVYLARYFEAGIFTAVQNKHSNFVKMWQSSNIASTHHLNDLMTTARLLSQQNRNFNDNSPYLPME